MLNPAKSLLRRILRRPPLGPPTSAESRLINELRATMASLPPAFPEARSESERAWAKRCNELRSRIQNDDPREFLEWTLWTGFTRWGNAAELQMLKREPDWRTYWRPAIADGGFGKPQRFLRHPWTSGPTVHQACVLLTLVKVLRQRPDQLQLIFEFGGGYGSLCRLIHVLGFRGIYILLDLPDFGAMQTFYLKGHGIPVHRELPAEGNLQPGVYVVSDVALLPGIIKGSILSSWFLSIMGITDTSLAFRQRFAPLLPSFEALFFLHQAQFCEVDNFKYIEELRAQMPEHQWTSSVYENSRDAYVSAASKGAIKP